MTQTFIGYICNDIVDLNNGVKTFSLAYNPPGRDKNAIFIKCIMFKEIVAAHIRMLPYIKKGSGVSVSGLIYENTAYETKNGEYKASLKLNVYNISFIPKSTSQNSNEDDVRNSSFTSISETPRSARTRYQEEQDGRVGF